MSTKRKLKTPKKVAHQPNSGTGRKSKQQLPTQEMVGSSLKVVVTLINKGLSPKQIPNNHLENLRLALDHQITPSGYESFEIFKQTIQDLGILAILQALNEQ